MLREKHRTLFRLSTGQQLVDSTVNGNEATWIIMPEIHEHHPHPQLTQKLLVEGFQSAVPAKANQPCVKIQIKTDRPYPIDTLHHFLITFQPSAHLRQHIGVFSLRSSNRRNFQ